MKANDLIAHKIISRDDIPALFHEKFRQEHRLVFTNGCFDILHKGHLHLLKAAKDLGDILIVGLNSDASVRNLKGENRPVKDQETRAELLASIIYVDFVILFGEDTPYDLIQLIRPGILVKGGDYKPEDIVGYDIVTAYGGSVKTIPFLEGFSSTALIRKLAKK